MGMAARAVEEGNGGGRGSGWTEGEGVVRDEEVDMGENMMTSSKTGQLSL